MDTDSTCEIRPEYACYQDATCEMQPDGECGFTPTDELAQCFADNGATLPGTPPGTPPTPTPCMLTGCSSQLCFLRISLSVGHRSAYAAVFSL